LGITCDANPISIESASALGAREKCPALQKCRSEKAGMKIKDGNHFLVEPKHVQFARMQILIRAGDGEVFVADTSQNICRS
jgi:hypothetical protein